MHPDIEKTRPLLMGLIDGELIPEEAAEVNQALIRSQALRDEYERLRETSQRLEAISMLEPAGHVTRELWKSPYHRLARDGGVWLIIGGYILLVGYGLFEWLTSNEPAIPRIGVAAILLGAFMLLITLLRERGRRSAVDPYQEIQR